MGQSALISIVKGHSPLQISQFQLRKKYRRMRQQLYRDISKCVEVLAIWISLWHKQLNSYVQPKKKQIFVFFKTAQSYHFNINSLILVDHVKIQTFSEPQKYMISNKIFLILLTGTKIMNQWPVMKSRWNIWKLHKI